MSSSPPKYRPPHLRHKKASNQQHKSEIGHNYDEKKWNYDEKQWKLTFENNRVHEPQLVLNLEFVDCSTTHYNKLSESERSKVNDILLKIYDIYQPSTVDTNCGHKTDNSQKGQIHWKFNYTIVQYETLLAYIIKNINKKNANDIRIMQNHLKHFNMKHDEFLYIKQRTLFIRLENDINLYKSLLNEISEISVNNIDVDFKNIQVDLNDTNFDYQSASFFIKIQTDKNDMKQFKMVDYTKDINDGLEQFVTFIHQTRDLIKNRVSKINNFNKNASEYNQPLEWFELIIETKQHDECNIFIIIKCTVTILHFMLILSQGWFQKYDDIFIQGWFQKYCLFVEQSNQKYNQQKVTKAECFDTNHYVIQFAQHDKTLQSCKRIGIRGQNAQIEVEWSPNNYGGRGIFNRQQYGKNSKEKTLDWNKAINSQTTIMNNGENEYNSNDDYDDDYDENDDYDDDYYDDYGDDNPNYYYEDYDAINKNHSKRNTKY